MRVFDSRDTPTSAHDSSDVKAVLARLRLRVAAAYWVARHVGAVAWGRGFSTSTSVWLTPKHICHRGVSECLDDFIQHHQTHHLVLRSQRNLIPVSSPTHAQDACRIHVDISRANITPTPYNTLTPLTRADASRASGIPDLPQAVQQLRAVGVAEGGQEDLRPERRGCPNGRTARGSDGATRCSAHCRCRFCSQPSRRSEHGNDNIGTVPASSIGTSILKIHVRN